MIEQFEQIAHFARQIARIVEELNHLKTAGSSPFGTPTSASLHGYKLLTRL